MELNKIVQEQKEKLESEIVRLACDCSSLGPCDSIVVIENSYDFDGHEIPKEYKSRMSSLNLADDGWTTVDLNVTRTLENLSKLPDNAGYESFWAAVVDNVD